MNFKAKIILDFKYVTRIRNAKQVIIEQKGKTICG